MQKISAIITTFNEAHNIEAAIQTVSFADEIIVVDSFSTDNTVELAIKAGCTVLHHAYENPAKQKNWAIPQATHPWVLLLDADERISENLKQEIISEMENPCFDAYWMYRTNWFMGKKLAYSGIQNDKVIRIISRDKCRYNNKNVHEEINITANIKVKFFKNRLEHFTYKNLNNTLERMNRYGDYQVLDYKDKTKSVNFFHLHLKPAFRFFKHYIMGKGFLDGFEGYMFAYTQAYSVRIRYIKLKMHQKGLV